MTASPAAYGAAIAQLPGSDTSAAAATADQSGSDDGQAQHYDAVAATYESAFFYSSIEYRDWVMGHLLDHFRLPDQEAEIVDLGGGTGNFTQALAEAAQVRRRVLCVDAFAEMLEKARAHPRVEAMLLDAVAFASLPAEQLGGRYSHVLLKELVHHIPEEQIPALYSGLFSQLAPGGCAVTITRPQEVDYPLFRRAREIWKEHQPHHSVFTSAMEAAGFEVEVHAHEYPAELAKATWLGMMRDKFWSTFSHCTQQELEDGIAEVDRQYAGQDTVHFTDRLLFLVARKAAAADSEAGAAGAPAAQQTALAAAPSPAQQTALAAPVSPAQQHGQQRAAVLTPAQRLEYAERGFTGPLTVLSPAEAALLAQRYRQYAAALPGGTVSGDWRFKSHLLLPWVWELARHPRLVAAVSEALGGCRNILCWSTDWFCKQPGDGGFTGWHQDSTYVGLDPPDVVTAWLALTPSNAANGCLHFLPGSHTKQLPHVETCAQGNLLLKGQTILELEGEEREHIPLQPGQATLHHIRLAHRSGPAAPDSQPRLGLAIRYMAAHVTQSLDPRDSVTVVAGRDTFGLYRHERRPAADMDEAALQEHRAAVQAVYPPGFERAEGKGQP
ncbi:hypothetical protein ABPG75_005493 [Micractinium tetrahymenae]